MSRSKDKRYRAWRKEARDAASECAVCSSKKRLAVHHICDWSHYPELRYEQSNAVVLCGKCHRQYHTSFHGDYRTRCTEKDYARFVRLSKYMQEVGK